MHPVIIGLLHNTSADSWHPILFRDAPLPGGDSTLVRVKSVGHHTGGFATREEAELDVKESFPDVPFDREFVDNWNGEEIPALVCFIADGKLM